MHTRRRWWWRRLVQRRWWRCWWIFRWVYHTASKHGCNDHDWCRRHWRHSIGTNSDRRFSLKRRQSFSRWRWKGCWLHRLCAICANNRRQRRRWYDGWHWRERRGWDGGWQRVDYAAWTRGRQLGGDGCGCGRWWLCIRWGQYHSQHGRRRRDGHDLTHGHGCCRWRWWRRF